MAEHPVTRGLANVMAKMFTKRSAAVAVVVRKFVFLLCGGWGCCSARWRRLRQRHLTAPSSCQAVAAGFGYSWGSGTLISKVKRHPLNISGIGLGSVGVNEYTASGHVTGLRTAKDINGIFTAVGTGLTLGAGASIAEMRNENGVTIQLDCTTESLSASVAATGLQVSIAQ